MKSSTISNQIPFFVNEQILRASDLDNIVLYTRDRVSGLGETLYSYGVLPWGRGVNTKQYNTEPISLSSSGKEICIQHLCVFSPQGHLHRVENEQISIPLERNSNDSLILYLHELPSTDGVPEPNIQLDINTSNLRPSFRFSWEEENDTSFALCQVRTDTDTCLLEILCPALTLNATQVLKQAWQNFSASVEEFLKFIIDYFCETIFQMMEEDEQKRSSQGLDVSGLLQAFLTQWSRIAQLSHDSGIGVLETELRLGFLWLFDMLRVFLFHSLKETLTYNSKLNQAQDWYFIFHLRNSWDSLLEVNSKIRSHPIYQDVVVPLERLLDDKNPYRVLPHKEMMHRIHLLTSWMKSDGILMRELKSPPKRALEFSTASRAVGDDREFGAELPENWKAFELSYPNEVENVSINFYESMNIVWEGDKLILGDRPEFKKDPVGEVRPGLELETIRYTRQSLSSLLGSEEVPKVLYIGVIVRSLVELKKIKGLLFFI